VTRDCRERRESSGANHRIWEPVDQPSQYTVVGKGLGLSVPLLVVTPSSP
jgi:hypothetical protein